MEIRRIDGYDDPRFPRLALIQHGAFLAEGEPCWVEIVGPEAAIYHGKPECAGEVIEAFRFYAEHISRFADGEGRMLAEFPPVAIFDVSMDRLQPSQFYVNRDKLEAVSTFVRVPEDVVLPLVRYGDRYVSLDGHTRLAAALALGLDRVKGFLAADDGWVWAFVREAERRGIRAPRDMAVLDHGEYTIRWDRYCDEVFASGSV